MRGSELHRVKDCSALDRDRFETFFQKMKPLIRRLTMQVNPKKFGYPPDVIQSYFMDKFMFVFQKYQDCSDNKLNAMLISSLTMYKNKLVRINYNSDSNFNESMVSLDTLYSCGEEDDIEDRKESHYMRDILWGYMKKHLSEDEFLIFQTELDPPDWFLSQGGRITNMSLIEFFNLPRDRKAYKIVSAMRHHIEEVLEEAKRDLN